MKMKYDIHVATEAGKGDNVSLRIFLEKIGFKSDNLAEQHLIFDPETEKHYSSCPLLEIHASKKIATKSEYLWHQSKIHQAMTRYCVSGYWHTEFVGEDVHFEPQKDFELKTLPFRRLLSRPRPEHKIWDIHLSVEETLCPQALKDSLISQGIYYLARLKKIGDEEKRFAVFTVQGISSALEGRKLFSEVSKWLQEIGTPPCDMKFEVTMCMKTYGNPKSVPPTVKNINWI